MKKIIFIISILLIVSSGYAKEYKTGLTTVKSPQLGKVLADNPERQIINIGNWAYWIRDNGESAHTPAGVSGGFYPRGTAAAIYLDGIQVGGYQNGNLKVSGQVYTIGTERGYIDASGKHITQSADPRVRVYRIRKDWETLTGNQVRQEAAEFNLVAIGAVTDGQIQGILDQYELDWNEWPTELGAPYYDLNNNGIYEPDLGETPGIANADQTIWMVITDANVSTTRDLYGTDPIGIEMQITLWAYNQPGASLGQIVFKQIRIINKGDGDLTDAYISQWSDPDVGDAGDDLVGMDVERSMMYVYNGQTNDSQYDGFDISPPAAGYDFFAGPIVESPGDVAIFDLKEKEGYRNLPATSFGYFSAGGVYGDPGPYGNTEGAREHYNLMRGFAPIDDLENPTAWLDSDGVATKFPFDGDPVAGTGDNDSNPGDRRMLVNSGPFTLAEGDTQDIVLAVVGGLGDNNLSSITALRNNDEVAQKLFDDLFQSVPSAPSGPVTKAMVLEGSVLLNWGTDQEIITTTENRPFAGYAFQGYNVYQLPSASATKDQAMRIATFDIVDGIGVIEGPVFVPDYGQVVTVPVQFGADFGISRAFEVDHDYFTGGPLYEGSEYYFAVTAYNYNAAPDLIQDKSLESSLTPIIVTLASTFGMEYGAEHADDIETAHPEGPSDGSLTAIVVDPSQLTGDDYEVFFIDVEYFLDIDGLWKNTNAAGKEGLAKILDCSGSLVTVAALAAVTPGTFDLTFSFTMDCGSNWVDGIVLDFPAGISINSWEAVGDNAAGGQNCVNMEGTLDAATNSITWGNDLRGEWGCITGDITWVVNIDAEDFPLSVEYTVYDDVYDGTLVDATGTATTTELGYAYKTIEGWYVRNLDTGQILTPHSTQQGTAAADNIVGGVFVPAHTAGINSAPMAEGIRVLMYGPELGIKAVFETDADDVVLDANVGVYPPSLGTTGYILQHRDFANADWSGRTHDRFEYWGMDDIIIDFGEAESSLCFSYSGATTITETVSGDQSRAPFSLYRKKFPSGEMMRLFTGWWDTDGDNIWSVPGADTDWIGAWGAPSYEPVYAWQGYDAAGNEIPYDPANDAAYIAEGGLPNDTGQSFGTNPGFFNYPFVTATMMVMYTDDATVPWGNKIWLTTGKANTALDKFTFTAPENTTSDALVRDAVKKINVFPNPYYADNSQELNRFDNFVTFTHLPARAKIRIFSLDGKIVRELDQDSDSQYLRWDLRNHTNLPVASGIYFAHIDMDIDGQNLGTKILKLFIVQANQVIKYY